MVVHPTAPLFRGLTVRGSILAVIAALTLLATALTAAADTEALTAGPCIGQGESTLYSDTSGVGSTTGCSGSMRYIYSNVGPNGFACPLNGWRDTNIFCLYSTGATWVYSSHNLSFYFGTTYYNGIVNTYDD